MPIYTKTPKKILLLFTVMSVSLSQANADFSVIAHRGASGYLPEHTLEGAAAAHHFDVDYIEPDLVMTKDNRLVILHDHHIDTTTDVKEKFPKRKRKDGRYYAVDFTLKEIKSLNVHERMDLKTGKRVFAKRFPQKKSDFEVPTFEEFIELVQGLNQSRGKNIGIYPEIKKPEFHMKEGKDITKAVIGVLRKYGYEKTKNAIIQSFWPDTLKRLKKEFKTKIPLVQLIADDSWAESSADYSEMLTQKGLKKISEYAEGIGPWTTQLIEKDKESWKAKPVVKWAHSFGLKIHPYTHRKEQLPKGFSSDEEFICFLKNTLKVDGIFSDFGDVAKSASLSCK